MSPACSLFWAALAAATIRSETGDNDKEEEDAAVLPLVPVEEKETVPPTRAHVKPADTVRPGSSKPAIADKAVVVVVVMETDGAKAQISSVWIPIVTTTTTMTILNKSMEPVILAYFLLCCYTGTVRVK